MTYNNSFKKTDLRRLVNLSLLIVFQFCYLHWPPNNSMFVYEGEYEIFSNKEHLFDNLTHPVILLGITAQIILLLGCVLSNFNKKLNTSGVILLGAVVLLFFVVGILSSNYKIISSTVPYLLLSIVYFYMLNKRPKLG